MNERLQRMRNKLFDSRPCITAERLVLATEAYQKFAGDAVPIFRAKVVRYIMERMTTLLMEDELIVHSMVQRNVQRFNKRVTTVWIAAIVGL